MSVGIIGHLLLLIPFLSGALLIIIFSRRRGKGYPACGKCGYDVGGSVGTVTRCPECGSAFTEAGILPPRGKRNLLMLASGIALVVFVLGCVGTALITARYSMAEQQRAATAAQAATTAQQQMQQAAQSDQQGSGDASIDEAAQPSPPRGDGRGGPGLGV
ncbi:MAG: hypothetical protein V3T84_05170 [Phycisphaerales bacterium]